MENYTLRNQAEQAYSSGQLTEALAAYQDLCTRNPADTQAWHMQAAIHGMLGQFEDSANCFEQVIAQTPGTAALYKDYANVLSILSRQPEAIAALQKSIDLDPTDIATLTLLGKLYLASGKQDLAESVFRDFLDKHPESDDASSTLAHLQLVSGRTEAAAATLRQGLSHNPGSQRLLLALVEYNAQSGDLDSLRNYIASAIGQIENLDNRLYSIVRGMHATDKFLALIPVLKVLVEVFPEEYRFPLILADCQARAGNQAAAIVTLGKYLEKYPDYEAYMLLAAAYKNSSDTRNALATLDTAASIAPDDARPVVMWSRMSQESGDTESAIARLEAFIEAHPDSSEALVEAGDIQAQAGDYSRSELYYKQAINAHPNNAIAYNALGTLYLTAKQETEARDCFMEALRHNPELLPALCNIAHLNCSNGEYEQAITYYDKALDLDPAFETAISGKAAVHELNGENEAALTLIMPLVEANTRNVNTLLVYARTSHVAGKTNDAIGRLEQLLNNSLLTDSERMQLHFATGKLLDQQSEYDRAFRHYESGNKLNKHAFDGKVFTRFITGTITSFSHDNLPADIKSSSNETGLLFIVGMPRSGTSLTEQILSAHPDIFGAGELAHIRDIATNVPFLTGVNKQYPDGVSGLTVEILDRLSAKHAEMLHSLADGEKVIIDKMPSNFMFIGMIERLFPKARVLHCMRDPLDTCLSCYFQQFTRWQRFSYNQADLVLYYQQYRKLMQHWKSTLTIPIMDVSYEALVNDTEGQTRQILEFIGMDWHPACTDFHKSSRKVITASYDQVRKPIYKSSVSRWKNYEKHIAVLSAGLSRFYPE